MILDGLRGVGLLSQEWGENAPNGAVGIVFFDSPSQEFMDFLQEKSSCGLRRVLVVALAASALSGADSWRLLRHGASDTLCWGPDCPRQVVARVERWGEIDRLAASEEVRRALVGESAAWKAVVRQIIEIARFTNFSVLLTGESGTGKELAARLIHSLDTRPRKGDFVLLDCTTVVHELSGSEFFGHEKGAFTGAHIPRDGAFARANGGTLFLDEVGELPPALQAQLLRVVQEHSYKRVGGDTWLQTDFRLVCATHRDLLEDQAQGRFRSDFYYRIAAAKVHLPPLGERRTDIPLLVRHFAAQLWAEGQAPAIDPAVEALLLEREYPGNIRDLRQIVNRIRTRHVGPGPITPGDLPPEDRPLQGAPSPDWRDNIGFVVGQAISAGAQMKEIRRAAEAAAEQAALREEEGSLPRAARRLGLSDRALQMRRAARRETGLSRNEEEDLTA